MSVCKIYVVRHGQSVHNLEGIVSGHVNPKLTAEGVKQAEAARTRLAHISFDEVYSSDLERAVKTAEVIFGKPVPKSHQLFALRERNFGEIDGKPNHHWQDINDKHYRKDSPLTTEERWHHKPVNNMESDHEVSERFIDALTQIAKANMGKTVLVAAHGGTLRLTLIGLEHGTYKDFPSGSIRNASYIELSYNGKSLHVESSDDARV